MQTDQLEKAIQSVVEGLYEDESLRSNMSDSESKIVLKWAATWIDSQLRSVADKVQVSQATQSELARIKGALKSFNALAARGGELHLADAISVFESPLHVQSFQRDEIFRLLTALTSAVWEMRAEPSNAADSNAMVATEK
jgi:hypothetical protein